MMKMVVSVALVLLLTSRGLGQLMMPIIPEGETLLIIPNGPGRIKIDGPVKTERGTRILLNVNGTEYFVKSFAVKLETGFMNFCLRNNEIVNRKSDIYAP